MAATALSEADRRAFEANIWKFTLFRFLVNFQLWMPIWVLYLTDQRGLSLTQVTALDTAFWLFLVAMEVPTGAVADRYGRKVSLLTGAVANTVAVFVFGIADNYPVLLASYMAWGVAWTLFSGADAAFFYDSLKAIGKEHDYQRLFGRVFAFQSLGVLLSLPAGSFIADQTSLATPVVLSAGLMALAALTAFWFREPPRLEAGHRQLGYLEGPKQAARIIFGSPVLKYFMILAASIVATTMCIDILKQPFLDSHGVDVGDLWIWLIPGTLVGMGASLNAHKLIARFGSQAVVIAVPMVVLFALGLLGTFDSLGAWALVPVVAGASSFTYPLVSGYLNSRIPSSQRATILSMYQLLFALIVAGLEPLAGWIADEHGLPIAYRWLAVILAVSAAPLLALWIRASRNEPDATPSPVLSPKLEEA
ncbi:MAG: MFS transporter [Dehalococcoidia bacterium]